MNGAPYVLSRPHNSSIASQCLKVPNPQNFARILSIAGLSNGGNEMQSALHFIRFRRKIPMFVGGAGGSSNGRKTGSEPVNLGSSPSPPAAAANR